MGRIEDAAATGTTSGYHLAARMSVTVNVIFVAAPKTISRLPPYSVPV